VRRVLIAVLVTGCLLTVAGVVVGLRESGEVGVPELELLGGTAPPVAQVSLAAPGTRYHYVANVTGLAGPSRVGFNVLDIGAWEVESLPQGTRGLVWLGQRCPKPIDDRFRTTVRRLAQDPRVLGYYLTDEPYSRTCPGGPRALAGRAAFIRRVTGDRQRSFIALYRDFHAWRPSVTKVSMIGIVGFPCSRSHPSCDLGVIDEHVGKAARAGIPRRMMVPVYQAFGQEKAAYHYYRMPTTRQFRAVLARWARLLPNPPMDYAYGWDHQRNANPTLRDAIGIRTSLSTVFGYASGRSGLRVGG